MRAGDTRCASPSLVRNSRRRVIATVGARAGTSSLWVGESAVIPPYPTWLGPMRNPAAVYELLCKRFYVTRLLRQAHRRLQVLGGLMQGRTASCTSSGTERYGRRRRRRESPPAVGARQCVFLTAVEVGADATGPELRLPELLPHRPPDPEPTSPAPGWSKIGWPRVLSRELIERGVRAVVAAWWAVDDEGGTCMRQDVLQRYVGRLRNIRPGNQCGREEPP